eukprot:m.94882 g.94882  ORF g.94882 m.94882 type:complete len:1032 (+) comp13464_c2_seq1:103-3198(+)
MNVYLNEPDTTKTTGEGFLLRYSYGFASMRGWRIDMEDAHLTSMLDKSNGVVGVFDGHGGNEVSLYVAKHIAETIRASKGYKDSSPKDALCQSFLTLDEELKTETAIKELKQLGDIPDEPMDPEEAEALAEEAELPIEELMKRYGMVKKEGESDQGEKEPVMDRTSNSHVLQALVSNVDLELESESDDDDDDDESLCGDGDEDSDKEADNQVEQRPIEENGKLSPLMHCPFNTFEPVIRFSYEKDQLGVEPIPDELRQGLRWRLTTKTPRLVKNMLLRAGFKMSNKKNWVGQWGMHMKSSSYRNLHSFQKVNHFPGSFCVGRKDSLWKSYARMQAIYGKSAFNYFPECYLLGRDRARLKQAWDRGGGKLKWILKPNASARGIGIRVIHQWSQVPMKKSCIIQRYLASPYLVNSTKFDLRVYVYITSYDPLRIYVCRDGLVRFATQKYSNKRKSTSNRYMHLTNYSVNKKSQSFISNADPDACVGHKWGLLALFRYLEREKGVNTDSVWKAMCDVIIKTMIAADGTINSAIKANCAQRSMCHELFGFDIMLDADLKPWLIEVNISPSLHSSSQLDHEIKGKMIRDVFNLAGYTCKKSEQEDSSKIEEQSTYFTWMGARPLKPEEKSKHAYFIQRPEERDKILENLTDDDVLMLMETESEFSRRGDMQRVFPTDTSHQYLRFIRPQRYYNLLVDAWSRKWSTSPLSGREYLQAMAVRASRVKMAPPVTLSKAQIAVMHHRKFQSKEQLYRPQPLSRPTQAKRIPRAQSSKYPRRRPEDCTADSRRVAREPLERTKSAGVRQRPVRPKVRSLSDGSNTMHMLNSTQESTLTRSATSILSGASVVESEAMSLQSYSEDENPGLIHKNSEIEEVDAIRNIGTHNYDHEDDFVGENHNRANKWKHDMVTLKLVASRLNEISMDSKVLKQQSVILKSKITHPTDFDEEDSASVQSITSTAAHSTPPLSPRVHRVLDTKTPFTSFPLRARSYSSGDPRRPPRARSAKSSLPITTHVLTPSHQPSFRKLKNGNITQFPKI